MDSQGTDSGPQSCDFCERREPDPFWITWEKNQREIVLKGNWCSWSCYNRAFEQAWDEAANGYPLEIGGES